jgi:hypothetical protein
MGPNRFKNSAIDAAMSASRQTSSTGEGKGIYT